MSIPHSRGLRAGLRRHATTLWLAAACVGGRLQRTRAAALLLAMAAWACWALPAAARPAAGATGWPAPQATCNWNAPGHNPFMGDVVAAVDTYQDIPAAVRARLQARMARRAYDEVVAIRRDSIDGRGAYRSEIRDMHFGDGKRCATVDRSGWSASDRERGLVYCEAGHCILVPTVCRNVSRIRLAEGGAARSADAGTAPTLAGPVLLVADSTPPAAADLATSGGAGQAAPLSADTDTAALPLSQVTGTTQPTLATGSPGGTTFESLATPLATPGRPLDGADPRPPGPGLVIDPPGFLLPTVPALTNPVPEPATVLLLSAGLALLAWHRRRFSPG